MPTTLLALALSLGPWLAVEPPAVAPEDLLQKASATYQRGNGLTFNQTLDIVGERYTLNTYDDSPQDNAPPKTGRATVEAGALVLVPGADGLSEPLLIVPWGVRLYLVEKSRLGEFCRFAEAGSEPRKNSWGHWFLRKDDWKAAVPPGDQPEPCKK